MGTLAVAVDTSGPMLPALIAGAGDRAALRFLEYFTVNIRNKNTRAAYARAAADFFGWCEGQGIDALGRVQPVHVAAYIELLQGKRSAPTVKQHLACIRMLFDWLVIGQVTPTNPAHSVRGPRHSVTKGVTPVLSSEEATALLTGMDVSTVVGLRDRAIIAVMTYTFARVGAVVALTVEDYFSQKKRWWLRLHEKNGKLNEMPCHHKLEEYLDAYIKVDASFSDPKPSSSGLSTRRKNEMQSGSLKAIKFRGVKVWRGQWREQGKGRTRILGRCADHSWPNSAPFRSLFLFARAHYIALP